MPTPLLVIADDSPVYRELMTELLPDLGFPLLHCVTSRQAFAAIQQHQPDLLLLDINAFNADIGWNTLHQMWLAPAARRIPVLVCTTDPRIREKTAMLRAHGCNILEKPFEIDRLLNAIESLIGAPRVSEGDWLKGTELIPVIEPMPRFALAMR